jgi:hypothetical protein
VAHSLRGALSLLEEATGEHEIVYEGRLVMVSLRGRERHFPTVESFERALESAPDLAEVETIDMAAGYGTDRARVMLSWYSSGGASLLVAGKDKFAVAGIFKELKGELDAGRRWTQAPMLRPGFLFGHEPWIGIIGLATRSLLDGGVADAIGLGLIVLSLCTLALGLFMAHVEPSLVPPLELLKEQKAKTRSQTWSSRGLKGLAFLGIAVVGAVINEVTGGLF